MPFNISTGHPLLVFILLLMGGITIVTLGILLAVRSIRGFKNGSYNKRRMIARTSLGLLLLIFGVTLAFGSILQYPVLVSAPDTAQQSVSNPDTAQQAANKPDTAQQSANNPSTQQVYTCLVKGPVRGELSQDPIDFAMARGTD